MTHATTHTGHTESLREQADATRQADAEAAPAHDAHAAHGDRPPHLEHHYDTPKQQFEAVKLGMWLFLATEVLLFGGLFVLYAVYRGNNPELFQWGAQYLSTTMGTINTVVLILSSMTIAFAVRAAKLNQRRMLTTMLGLTVLGGAIFMGIKYVEYTDKFEKNLVWGLAFYEPPERDEVIVADDDEPLVAEVETLGDPDAGRTLWLQTCLACHGDQGQGVPGQAFDFRDSEFVLESSDEELLDFIKRGRQGFEPDSRTGIQMPPRGGNPLLSDDEIKDIVAYIRTLEMPEGVPDDEAGVDPADLADGDSAGADAAADDAIAHAGDAVENDAADIPAAQITEFHIPTSSIPPAREAPAGLTADWERRGWGEAPRNDAPAVDPLEDPDRPENAHLFFGIYFMMTGLHGLHVLVGMVIIATITFFAWRGVYSAAYYTPVEISGLYWHLVDVIWIFLFPLLYLIH